MLYFYCFLALAIFICDWIYYSKLDNEYEKKYIKYMKGNLENYFEVRYLRKQYFIYVIMCIPAGLAVLELSKEAEASRWLYVGVSVLFFTVPSMYLIYKSLQKIVYDHGEIRYCLGNIVRVRASIYDVDRENSYIYQVGEGASTRVSFIVFNSGDKIFFTTDSMDYGYKLEALMRKKELGIDPELEMLEELYKEDPDDEDLLEELKIARKGYDESKLKE